MQTTEPTSALCTLCRDGFTGTPEHTEESCAKGRILRWCRSNPRGEGVLVMRRLSDGRMAVVDLSMAAMLRNVAAGPDWRAVLADLIAKGKAL